MMLPWIMLAIMIAIGGLISIIWTAVVLYNSDLDSSFTTATLLLVFGLIGIGKYLDKIQFICFLCSPAWAMTSSLTRFLDLTQ
jgi:hypothetical protein